MKKTLALALAVVISATLFTLTLSAFAAEKDDPTFDPRMTTAATTASTTAATTASTTAATTASTTAATTEVASTPTASASATEKDPAGEAKTNPEGYTPVDDGNKPDKSKNANEKAPESTKSAKVDSDIPETGGGAVPAIALLTLAAGVTAVIKTRKSV